MQRKQSSNFGSIQLLTLAMTFAFIIPAWSAAIAADPKAKAKDDEKPDLKGPYANLTVAETRYARSFERRLVTKLNCKDNPGDRDTWYVLLFLDRAIAQTVGATTTPRVQSVTIATLRLMKPDGLVVQGKQNAALAIARHLAGPNNAATGVRPPLTGERNNASRLDGDKQWEFRAFKSELDARAFLAQVLPKDDKKK